MNIFLGILLLLFCIASVLTCFFQTMLGNFVSDKPLTFWHRVKTFPMIFMKVLTLPFN